MRLWRLCDAQGLHKAEVQKKGDAHSAGEPLPVQIRKNYIIFSKSAQVVAADPPLVANHRKGDEHETWLDTDQVQKLRRAVFAESDRWLRTSNPQQPHRHIARDLTDHLSWPERIRTVLGAMRAESLCW